MESYLKYTLGLHVSIRTWNDSNTLPDELKREKEYSLLEICGITCLIITVREVDFQLSVFERKCEELHKYCKYPFVLCFDRITSYQRKCLIESGQSFVVPNNQLYMPFLGIALQEHFKAQPIAGTQLTAMAQYILLFFLYKKTNADFTKFSDSNKISDFAKWGMNWAVGTGVITGTTEKTLIPQGTASREEAAAMIYKYFLSLKNS